MTSTFSRTKKAKPIQSATTCSSFKNQGWSSETKSPNLRRNDKFTQLKATSVMVSVSAQYLINLTTIRLKTDLNLHQRNRT